MHLKQCACWTSVLSPTAVLSLLQAEQLIEGLVSGRHSRVVERCSRRPAAAVGRDCAAKAPPAGGKTRHGHAALRRWRAGLCTRHVACCLVLQVHVAGWSLSLEALVSVWIAACCVWWTGLGSMLPAGVLLQA